MKSLTTTEPSFESYKSLEDIEFAFKFYKDFYDKNSIALVQYSNLRYYFNKMVKIVLGENYYNMGIDVYESDRITCKDIINISKRPKIRQVLSKLFKIFIK